jgi:hypothetical protein
MKPGTFKLYLHLGYGRMTSRKELADAMLEATRQVIFDEEATGGLIERDGLVVGSWSIEHES